MRKLICILSLLMVTVFLTGHYFIYKTVLQNHKREFITHIDSRIQDIETIEIVPSQLYSNSENLNWMDNNEEICMNGMVYDVLKISNTGTKVILYVISDVSEMELIGFFNEQLDQIYQSNKKGEKNNNLLKNFLSLEFFNQVAGSLGLFVEEYQYSLLKGIDLSLDYFPILIQPPRA